MMHMMMMPERHHPIDALFEDVFGGFPTTMMMSGDYHGMRARSTRAARRVLRDVKVEETSRGYASSTRRGRREHVEARGTGGDSDETTTTTTMPVGEMADVKDAKDGGSSELTSAVVKNFVFPALAGGLFGWDIGIYESGRGMDE